MHSNHCFESDHTSAQCALAYFDPISARLPQGKNSAEGSGHTRGQNIPHRRPESISYICASWNKGACAFPSTCTFRHVCATCQGRHMAWDCPSTPESSEYFRSRLRMASGSSPAVTSNNSRMS